MTPEDERRLYKQDIHAWARAVAPRRALLLAGVKNQERRKLWDSFGRESQQALTELAKERLHKEKPRR